MKPKKPTIDDVIADARAEEKSVDPETIEAAREVIQKILREKRSSDQDGYTDYHGDGKWAFVSSSLSVTGDDLNTLFAFAGIVPDAVVPLGSCETCRFSETTKGSSRGWGRPCVSCAMPKHSNWEPRPKGWKPEPRDR